MAFWSWTTTMTDQRYTCLHMYLYVYGGWMQVVQHMYMSVSMLHVLCCTCMCAYCDTYIFRIHHTHLHTHTHTHTQLLQCLIHCADLSNQGKEESLATSWSHKIMEESFLQGDEEKKRGIPMNPMGNRKQVSIEKCQVSSTIPCRLSCCMYISTTNYNFYVYQ